MKRYVVLIITVFLTSTAFSQKSTEKTSVKNEDSTIRISKAVARQILKDIYRNDSLKAELYVIQENYKLLESNVSLKDSIISNKNSVIDAYKEREKNFNEIISLKDKQIKEYTEYSDKLKTDINKSKKKVKLGISATVLSSLLAIGLGLLQ